MPPETHQRIEITRADYQAMFGYKADQDTIGACFYAQDAKTILVEYVFIEPQEDAEFLRACGIKP